MVRSFSLTVAALVLTTGVADAKIMLITHGETIAKVGDVANKPDPSFPANVAVGYKYSYGGLFWLDFWRWDGEYCLFAGEDWQPIDEPTAAKLLGVSQDKLVKPFWYRFPPVPFVVGVLLVLFVPLGVYGMMVDANRRKRYDQLKKDPAYKAALKIATAKPAAEDEDDKPEGTMSAPRDRADTDADCFDAGLDHLVKAGVDEAEARTNLRLMVEVKAELEKEKQQAAESQS
jgi:hypothetical protein